MIISNSEQRLGNLSEIQTYHIIEGGLYLTARVFDCGYLVDQCTRRINSDVPVTEQMGKNWVEAGEFCGE